MPDCPNPQKTSFKSFTTARRYALRRALQEFEAERHVDALYGYRCECGSVHLTSRRKWDGGKHILLARIRPQKKIADAAYKAGLAAQHEAPGTFYATSGASHVERSAESWIPHDQRPIIGFARNEKRELNNG